MTSGISPICTCGAVGDLHSITCLITAWTDANAMINNHGDVFYPDSPEDAELFATVEGARPLAELANDA